jgi:translation elongation factor EF-Tu-like GTPase
VRALLAQVAGYFHVRAQGAAVPGAIVDVQFLDPRVGGREKTFVTAPYRPHFRVGDGELLGIQFFDGPDSPVRPGEVVAAKVRFMYFPSVNYDALIAGAQFEVREGSRIVGVGVVREVLP